MKCSTPQQSTPFQSTVMQTHQNYEMNCDSVSKMTDIKAMAARLAN